MRPSRGGLLRGAGYAVMSVEDPAPADRPRSREVLAAVWRCRSLFLGVGLFTALINVLALTGSLYMLQVYDRVIPSHSLPTLVGMTVLMVGLYVVCGVLDFIRARVMVRVGLRVEKQLRERVFACVQELPLRLSPSTDPMLPLRDLDRVRSFLSSTGPAALFDAPWMPMYLGLVYALHPWLGMLALAGGMVLMALTAATEYRSRRPMAKAARSGSEREAAAEAARRGAEAARAMGFAGNARQAWMLANSAHLQDQTLAADAAMGLAAVSRVFRLLLQSAVLGLGAWLVIRGEASGGVMIAASILTSRALAPLEIAIANWRGFVAARQAGIRLGKFLAALPGKPPPMPLPAPSHRLGVEALWVAAPGSSTPILHNVSFALDAGAGLGIVGPSASGKTSLARALVGIWQPLPNRGAIRLDGASISQWDPDVLGRHIGYLPQDLQLFEGSIKANICRQDANASSEAVIEAARAAGAHDLIVRMPNGYETQVGDGGSALSAGQRQRIALARALFGNPFLIVLDEPNSNLDAEGEVALAQAITSARARGAIVIVIAHRPSALASVDQVLVLAGGQVRAFGQKDQVLRAVSADASGAGATAASARAPGLKIIADNGSGG